MRRKERCLLGAFTCRAARLGSPERNVTIRVPRRGYTTPNNPNDSDGQLLYAIVGGPPYAQHSIPPDLVYSRS